MSETSDYFYERHKSHIERYLAGEEVTRSQLWMSVGYFWHGAGRFCDRTFATDGQWYMLLLATDRRSDAQNHRESV